MSPNLRLELLWHRYNSSSELEFRTNSTHEQFYRVAMYEMKSLCCPPKPKDIMF